MAKPQKALLPMFQNPYGSKPRSGILTMLLKIKQNERSFVKTSLRAKNGLSLIEILVAIAIISTTLVSLLGLTSFALRITSLINQTNRANNIAQELMEQVRNFRDGTSWNVDGLGTVATNTDYYIQKSGMPLRWQPVEGIELINVFTKKIVFEDVMRDANDNIITAGGINDPNTKKVSVTVFWDEKGASHQIELVSYFTNWRQ